MIFLVVIFVEMTIILKRGKNMKFFNEEIKPINNNCWTNCDDCENCDGCISCDYLPE